MASDMTLQLKQARLGTAPPGSTLAFKITKGKGFSVNALLECDMKLIASWESIEISGGQTIEERLLPTGIYTLQVSIAYRGTEPVDVIIDLSVSSDNGGPKTKQLSFKGKKPDIGRAVAVVRIQNP